MWMCIPTCSRSSVNDRPVPQPLRAHHPLGITLMALLTTRATATTHAAASGPVPCRPCSHRLRERRTVALDPVAIESEFDD